MSGDVAFHWKYLPLRKGDLYHRISDSAPSAEKSLAALEAMLATAPPDHPVQHPREAPSLWDLVLTVRSPQYTTERALYHHGSFSFSLPRSDWPLFPRSLEALACEASTENRHGWDANGSPVP